MRNNETLHFNILMLAQQDLSCSFNPFTSCPAQVFYTNLLLLIHTPGADAIPPIFAELKNFLFLNYY